MKRFATFLGLVLGTTILSLSATTTPAHACSIAVQYSPNVALFESGDFNLTQSEFDQSYQAEAYGEQATPEIFGVYRVEIVATVDPAVLSGSRPIIDSNPVEISRGSVAVVTDYWGQAPDKLAPYSSGFPEKWERKPDTGACESLSYPPNHELGQVWYRALTSEGTLEVRADDTQASKDILNTGFNPGTSVERDEAAEQNLIDEMQAEHDRILASGDSNLITLLVLPAAVLLAAGVYALTHIRQRKER